MNGKREESRLPGMNDAQIVALYFARDEQAIHETDRKFGCYLLLAAQNILHDESDSEECRNDAYLIAWNNMLPSNPRLLAAYLVHILRNHAIDRWRML